MTTLPTTQFIQSIKAIVDPTRDEMLSYLRDQFSGYGPESLDDDAEVAMYWFASDYHGGQWSNLYSALSVSPFRPGCCSRGPEPESVEADMYASLQSKFASVEA